MDIYQFQDDLPNKQNNFPWLHYQRVHYPSFATLICYEYPIRIPIILPYFYGISYDFPMFPMGFSLQSDLQLPSFPAGPCTWPAQREAARGPAGRRSASHSPARGVSVFSAALTWGNLGIYQKGDDGCHGNMIGNKHLKWMRCLDYGYAMGK